MMASGGETNETEHGRRMMDARREAANQPNTTSTAATTKPSSMNRTRIMMIRGQQASASEEDENESVAVSPAAANNAEENTTAQSANTNKPTQNHHPPPPLIFDVALENTKQASKVIKSFLNYCATKLKTTMDNELNNGDRQQKFLPANSSHTRTVGDQSSINSCHQDQELELAIDEVTKFKDHLLSNYSGFLHDYAVDNAKQCIQNSVAAKTAVQHSSVALFDWANVVDALLLSYRFSCHTTGDYARGNQTTISEAEEQQQQDEAAVRIRQRYWSDLEQIGEFGFVQHEKYLIHVAMIQLQQKYLDRAKVVRMSSPAQWLEIISWLRLELLLLNKRSDCLLDDSSEDTKMISSRLLLPVSGCLLARLEELITVHGFTNPTFLQSIPPQIELILCQIVEAIRMDLKIGQSSSTEKHRQQPPLTLRLTQQSIRLIQQSLSMASNGDDNGKKNGARRKNPLRDMISAVLVDSTPSPTTTLDNISEDSTEEDLSDLVSDLIVETTTADEQHAATTDPADVVNKSVSAPDTNGTASDHTAVTTVVNQDVIQQSIFYLQKYLSCGGRSKGNRRDRCRHLLPTAALFIPTFAPSYPTRTNDTQPLKPFIRSAAVVQKSFADTPIGLECSASLKSDDSGHGSYIHSPGRQFVID